MSNTLFSVEDSAGAVVEDSILIATGIAKLSDHTLSSTASFEVMSDVPGQYGSLSIAADGAWIYTLFNTSPVVQSLRDQQVETDQFLITWGSGSAFGTVTIHVSGRNDPALISGDTEKPLFANLGAQVSGSLVVFDDDYGEKSFRSIQSATGLYGNFSLSSNGNWSYSLTSIPSSTPTGVDSVNDVFSVQSLDGTTTSVKILIMNAAGAPTVTTFSPADEASAVAIASDIVLTFNEAIQRGTGSIVLKNASGTTIATYDAATSSNLTISGSTLTINPTADLSYSTGYKVEFANGSIKDLAGNSYAGTTAYNFSTVAAPGISLYLYFNGNTYFISTTARNWSDASSAAKASGWDLAVVSSAAENAAIYNYAITTLSSAPSADDGGGANYLWLGASDSAVEGTWKWLDGTSVAGYTNWGSGSLGTEPDNYGGLQDALGLALSKWPQPSGGIGVAGQWNDLNPADLLYSVWEATGLLGTSGNDAIVGSSVDEVLIGYGGNDTLDGGGGSDAAVYSGPRSNYFVTKTTNGYTVTDSTGAEGTDTLTNVLGLMFSDTIVFLAQSNSGGSITPGLGTRGVIGGSGIDTAILSGNKANYKISIKSNGDVVAASTDNTVTLTSIEKLQFADTSSADITSLLPAPKIRLADASSYKAKVESYFLATLDRAASAAELIQFQSLLASQTGSVWMDASGQTGTTGSLVAYLTQQSEYATLALKTNTQIVDQVYQQLTGTLPTSTIETFYVDQLTRGSIKVRGLVNAVLNDLELMPRVDGVLFQPSDWPTHLHDQVTPIALVGMVNNLHTKGSIGFDNLDASGNLGM